MADQTLTSGDHTADDSTTHETRKRHGDKLGAAAGTARPAPDADEHPASGDSPKRQGDPMAAVLRPEPKG